MRKASCLWRGGRRPQTRVGGRTHQQLRLKTFSRREKLGFMAGTLGGAGRLGLRSDGRVGDSGGRAAFPAGNRAQVLALLPLSREGRGPEVPAPGD